MALPLPAEDRGADGITDTEGIAAVRFMTRNWTGDDLEHLPSGNRYEILDGRLLVTPPASEAHQNLAKWLFRYLDRAVPDDGWRVQWDIGLDYGVTRRFIPDLVVLPPEAPEAAQQYNAIVPALVVEVESKSTKDVDRVGKAEAYAEAGIESYWRMERDGRLTIGHLDGDRYKETAYAPDEAVTVDHPYPVTIPARP